jgi:hypothetical protein
MAEMHQLDWLVGCQFRSLVRREFDWVFEFNNDTYMVVGCLWRLTEDGRIRTTGSDDGHVFGLQLPADAAGQINSRLRDSVISTVDLQEGVLDLTVHFGTKYSVQLLPDSSGYEAWQVCHPGEQVIATGGGELVTVKNGTSSIGSIIHGNT